jgi:hypothetical protein
MIQLLFASHTLYDAFEAQASPELIAWLEGHKKVWKYQVKLNLPCDDHDHLAMIVATFDAILSNPDTSVKRTKSVTSLRSKVVEALPETPAALPVALDDVTEIVEEAEAAEAQQIMQDELLASLEGTEEDPEVNWDEPVAEAPVTTMADLAPQLTGDEKGEKAVAAIQTALAPLVAPPAPVEPVQAPKPVLVAQHTSPAMASLMAPQDRVVIPPPEARAKLMLGDLYRAIKSAK